MSFALCIILASSVDVTAQHHDAAAWRLRTDLAREVLLDRSLAWSGGEVLAGPSLVIERELPGLVGGLSAVVAIDRRSSTASGALDLSLFEARLGASYELALWRTLYPYLRGAASLTHFSIDAGSDLRASRFAPGLEGALGMRVMLPGFGSGKRFRFFGALEAAYHFRLPGKMALRPSDDEGLRAVPLPLGRVDPSSWGIGGALGLEL